MPDQKTMYAKLFNKITDVVEEMYIESGEREELRSHNLKILDLKEKNK